MALTQRGLAALADELKPYAGHDLVHRIMEVDRVEDKSVRNVIGLGREQKPARTRDPDHLVDNGAGIGRMDQNGLAGHQIEARVRERQPFGDGNLIAEAAAKSGYTRCRVLDPVRIAVDALHARGRRQDLREQPTPMADATADVEDISHSIERKPPGHQFEEVEVPPMIAGIAEMLGRVGIERAELVGHCDLVRSRLAQAR